jgi:hypothetical protein
MCRMRINWVKENPALAGRRQTQGGLAASRVQSPREGNLDAQLVDHAARQNQVQRQRERCIRHAARVTITGTSRHRCTAYFRSD